MAILSQAIFAEASLSCWTFVLPGLEVVKKRKGQTRAAPNHFQELLSLLHNEHEREINTLRSEIAHLRAHVAANYHDDTSRKTQSARTDQG